MYATNRKTKIPDTYYYTRPSQGQKAKIIEPSLPHTYTVADKFEYYLLKLYAITRDDYEGHLALSLSNSHRELPEIQSLYRLLGETLRLYEMRGKSQSIGGVSVPSKGLFRGNGDFISSHDSVSSLDVQLSQNDSVCPELNAEASRACAQALPARPIYP